MMKSSKDERIRVECARTLLERGYGRPIQPVDVDLEFGAGNGAMHVHRIETVILREGENEVPMVEGIDYFDIPSTDPEIEAQVQRESAALLVNEIHREGDSLS